MLASEIQCDRQSITGLRATEVILVATSLYSVIGFQLSTYTECNINAYLPRLLLRNRKLILKWISYGVIYLDWIVEASYEAIAMKSLRMLVITLPQWFDKFQINIDMYNEDDTVPMDKWKIWRTSVTVCYKFSTVGLCRDLKTTTWRLVHPTQVFVLIQKIKLLTYSKIFLCTVYIVRSIIDTMKIILVFNEWAYKSWFRPMLHVDGHDCL